MGYTLRHVFGVISRNRYFYPQTEIKVQQAVGKPGNLINTICGTYLALNLAWFWI